MIQLVAFFGNYGKEYSGNRHNAAWIFSEQVKFLDGLSWQSKFKGQYASLDLSKIPVPNSDLLTGEGKLLPVATNASQKIHFIKPETYMNLSGESVFEVAKFFKIPTEDILIIHDELELQPGFCSLKWSGGLGGHNGLRSMKTCFGTADFWRIRIGIGRPANGSVADYVLSDFSSDERIILAQEFLPLSRLLAAILIQAPQKYVSEWAKRRLCS